MVRLRDALGAVLVLLAMALAASGCGGGQSGPNDRTVSLRQEPAVRRDRQASARGCPLGSFLKTLDQLESRLAVGLSYQQYFAQVSAARDTYEVLPVQKLELPCLVRIGTPAEKALDEYIDAANLWRGCRAQAACVTYSIEPRLQRDWRVASHFLTEVREGRT